METNEEIRSSHSFLLKKWALFSFNAICIVITVIFVVLVEVFGIRFEDQINKLIEEDYVFYVWIGPIHTTLIHLVGLLGSYKENYWLSVTYSVLIIWATLVSVYMTTELVYYWFESAVYLMSCCLTYSYIYDLDIIRSNGSMDMRPNSLQMVMMTDLTSNTSYMIPSQWHINEPGHSYTLLSQHGNDCEGQEHPDCHPPRYSAQENLNSNEF